MVSMGNTIAKAIETDTTKTPGQRLAVWMASEGLTTHQAAATRIGVSRPTLSAALRDSGRLQFKSYRTIESVTGIGGWL
jgi:transcriptional regulator with XRE-family HTH domain